MPRSARDNTAAPTFAPQPPHRIASEISALLAGQGRRRCLGQAHLRQFVELAHETAVDPVLPAPHPLTLEGKAIASADGIGITGRDQIERVALRPVLAELSGLAACGEYCRPAPGRHALRRLLTSAGRVVRKRSYPRQRIRYRARTARNDASTIRNPRVSSGNPVCSSQRGAAACVAHNISSASTGG